MTIFAFADKTLNKWYDPKLPPPRQWCDCRGQSLASWEGGEAHGFSFSFAQSAQQFPTHLKCGVSSIVNQRGRVVSLVLLQNTVKKIILSVLFIHLLAL